MPVGLLLALTPAYVAAQVLIERFFPQPPYDKYTQTGIRVIIDGRSGGKHIEQCSEHRTPRGIGLCITPVHLHSPTRNEGPVSEYQMGIIVLDGKVGTRRLPQPLSHAQSLAPHFFGRQPPCDPRKRPTLRKDCKTGSVRGIRSKVRRARPWEINGKHLQASYTNFLYSS